MLFLWECHHQSTWYAEVCNVSCDSQAQSTGDQRSWPLTTLTFLTISVFSRLVAEREIRSHEMITKRDFGMKDCEGADGDDDHGAFGKRLPNWRALYLKNVLRGWKVEFP